MHHFTFPLAVLLLFRHPVVSDSLRPHGLQHVRPPCPHHLSEFAQVHVHCIGNAVPPSHPLTPSYSCPGSFPALGTFPVSHLFASDDQNTGASASASVLSVNIQGWSHLRLTRLISLLSKGLSSPAPQFEGINSLVFCLYGPALTTILDHWEDHSLDYTDLCQQSNVSAFQYSV